MYRDQFGEFACGYWGLKGFRVEKNSMQYTASLQSVCNTDQLHLPMPWDCISSFFSDVFFKFTMFK